MMPVIVSTQDSFCELYQDLLRSGPIEVSSDDDDESTVVDTRSRGDRDERREGVAATDGVWEDLFYGSDGGICAVEDAPDQSDIRGGGDDPVRQDSRCGANRGREGTCRSQAAGCPTFPDAKGVAGAGAPSMPPASACAPPPQMMCKARHQSQTHCPGPGTARCGRTQSPHGVHVGNASSASEREAAELPPSCPSVGMKGP